MPTSRIILKSRHPVVSRLLIKSSNSCVRVLLVLVPLLPLRSWKTLRSNKRIKQYHSIPSILPLLDLVSGNKTMTFLHEHCSLLFLMGHPTSHTLISYYIQLPGRKRYPHDGQCRTCKFITPLKRIIANKSKDLCYCTILGRPRQRGVGLFSHNAITSFLITAITYIPCHPRHIQT